MLAVLLIGLGLVAVVSAQASAYGQCGGLGWTGPTTCVAGWTCTFSNEYYSQCLQGTTISSSTIVTTVSSGPSTTSSVTSSTSSVTLTGIAATAPTTPPSPLTGKAPALGWNAWNAYGCNFNETKILAAANQFISLGLKDVGYEYVNIDDCWALMARDATTGRIVPDPNKFPSGMSNLTSQIHALGLKAGIYSDAGTNTCAGFPGSLGHEALDAATFSGWGIDYLKYDNCNVPANWTDSGVPPGNDWYNSNSAIRYRQMTAALAAQPNPIQFNLCIWGAANVWDWGARVGHSWRMSGDSSASWSYITSIITTNVAHLTSVQFGAHNDMDMMEIGNGDLTIEEQRTHFAMWVALKSPILLGTDLSLLDSTQISIISNAELLAFHQDASVGTPAAPFTPSASAPTTSPPEYYAGPSSKGTHVFIMNTSASTATKTFEFANVPGLGTGTLFKVRDMWAGADLAGTYASTASFSVSIAPHDTAVYLITPA